MNASFCGDSRLLGGCLTARHMPSLDGVRGIAILWVMLFHLFPLGDRESWWGNLAFEFTWMGGWGWICIFVLSGFLIRRILVGSREAPRYFINFYSRRFLRIFSLYYHVYEKHFLRLKGKFAGGTPAAIR